jgi:hypothetical protein
VSKGGHCKCKTKITIFLIVGLIFLASILAYKTDTISLPNKNCLGSFQVLWNKNCTTENEEIMMEKLI